MRISAIGNSEAGFTLVEALTTLALVALIASAVMLTLPGPERETRAFAERFAARVALAGEESIIANRPVALVMNDEGYGFARLEETGWRDMNAPLSFRPWPAGLDARVEADEAGDSDRAVRFDPMGAATPARVILASPGARWRIDIDGQGRAHVARDQ